MDLKINFGVGVVWNGGVWEWRAVPRQLHAEVTLCGSGNSFISVYNRNPRLV